MAGNVLTDLQIFNKALLRLGETSQVIALDGSDTSKYGLLASLEYYATRDEELRSHRWLFALKESPAVIAAVSALASWALNGTTVTLSGLTINGNSVSVVALTGNITLGNTLITTLSVVPLPTWIGQGISGVGIPVGAIIQQIDYINKTVTISKPATATTAALNMNISPVLVGWLVTAGLNPGNVIPLLPSGIPARTFITNVQGNTLTISGPATVAATNVVVTLQPLNALGYWYMYNVPQDELMTLEVYLVLPSFIYQFPWKVTHRDMFPHKIQGQYLYTDLDPNNGQVFIKYIAQVSDTTQWPADFVDMLVIRLASKLALYASGELAKKMNFEQEYMTLNVRAQTNNLIEQENEPNGDPWWTDR